MSRLFSQLENIGHDRTDVERPAPDQQAAAAGGVPAPAQAGPHDLSAATRPPAEAPAGPNDYSPASAVRSQIPGYAIASQLALSSSPRAPAAPSRSTWPVRLWFVSLLALAAISLAMLLAPRDDNTAAQRPVPRPAAMPSETAADDAASPAPPSPSPPAMPPSSSPAQAEAIAGKKPTPAATPVSRLADKPVARRQPSPPPAEQAAAPRAPAGAAGCSEAMAAMNLCSASHP